MVINGNTKKAQRLVNPKYVYLGIALSRVKWEVSYIIR